MSMDRAEKSRKQREWYAKKLATDPTWFQTRRQKANEKYPGRNAAYQKKYHQKCPERYTKSYAKHQTKNLEKLRAKIYAQRYTKLGDKCEVCGSTENLERHHDDYSKPLEVRTLCHKHNMPIHVEKTILPPNRHCDNCNKNWPNCGKIRPMLQGKYSCVFWEVALVSDKETRSK